MATGQQQHAALATASTQDLLDTILDRPVSERARVIGVALDKRIGTIEEMLPDFMKGQGARLAKRAQLTFAKNPDLDNCPPDVFIRCVLEAAEFGFAIDGKLAYVVKYKSTYQMQLDYKAIVAVAKRMKTIRDIYADVVYENDHFRAYRKDGESFLIHERPLGQPRGEKAIGAYAVISLADGQWRYELMDISELNKVQAAAPSKAGPWSTWTDEQRKKTVVRRSLKMYADDPGVIRLLELTEDEEIGDVDLPQKTIESVAAKLSAPPPPAKKSEPATNGNGSDHPPAPSRREIAEQYDKQEPEKPDETSQLDPLEGIQDRFSSFESRADAKRLYDELCGPEPVVELSDAQRSLVTGWYEESCKRIDPPKSKATKQPALAGTT